MSEAMSETLASPGRFLDIGQVAAETTLSRATIYRRIKRGGFPKGHMLRGNERRFWTEAEIEQWKAEAISDAPN